MRMRTAREIKRLIKTAKIARTWVAPNLYLQISPSGVASWTLRYMRHGKQRDHGFAGADVAVQHQYCPLICWL